MKEKQLNIKDVLGGVNKLHVTGGVNPLVFETTSQMVARTLANRYNVPVYLTTGHTRTDGKAIYINKRHADGDIINADVKNYYDGLLDHEIAHLIHTGDDPNKEKYGWRGSERVKYYKRYFSLSQVCEDIRVNCKMAKEYPGSYTNIYNTLKLYSDNEVTKVLEKYEFEKGTFPPYVSMYVLMKSLAKHFSYDFNEYLKLFKDERIKKLEKKLNGKTVINPNCSYEEHFEFIENVANAVKEILAEEPEHKSSDGDSSENENDDTDMQDNENEENDSEGENEEEDEQDEEQNKDEVDSDGGEDNEGEEEHEFGNEEIDGDNDFENDDEQSGESDEQDEEQNEEKEPEEKEDNNNDFGEEEVEDKQDEDEDISEDELAKDISDFGKDMLNDKGDDKGDKTQGSEDGDNEEMEDEQEQEEEEENDDEDFDDDGEEKEEPEMEYDENNKDEDPKDEKGWRDKVTADGGEINWGASPLVKLLDGFYTVEEEIRFMNSIESSLGREKVLDIERLNEYMQEKYLEYYRSVLNLINKEVVEWEQKVFSKSLVMDYLDSEGDEIDVLEVAKIGLLSEMGYDNKDYRINKLNTSAKSISTELLIDLSGSMAGTVKATIATKIAILLSEVLKKVNVDFEVTGWHSIPVHGYICERIPDYKAAKRKMVNKLLRKYGVDDIKDAKVITGDVEAQNDITFKKEQSGKFLGHVEVGYNSEGEVETKTNFNPQRMYFGREACNRIVVFKNFSENNTLGLSMIPKCCNYENADGAAIELVAQRLLARTSDRKFLFVLTDGMPTGYRNNVSGEAHLHFAVQKLRENGVEVFAIGFDQIAQFYGRKNCIIFNRYDDNNEVKIEQSIVKLITKRIYEAM